MPLWREGKRGFFKLTGALLVVLGVAAWGAIGAARQAGDAAGRWSWWLTLAFAAITLVWLVLLFARAAVAARAGGFLSLGVAVAMLAALAGTAEGSHAVSLLQLLAGSVFMGAVLDGLLLGHWYLTDRGLSRGPINRFALALLGAVVLAAAGVAAVATGRTVLCPAVSGAVAVTAGLAAGLALFGGTRAFVWVVERLWPAFRRHAEAIYDQRGGLSLSAAVGAALVVVAGEELFWRGLAQGRLSQAAGRAGGAVATWAGYCAANAPSGSLPIL